MVEEEEDEITPEPEELTIPERCQQRVTVRARNPFQRVESTRIYAYIHNWFAPYSDGFISYSDGVHDDVNKTVWSALGWNPNTNLRDILVEYCRVFFEPAVAEEATDGIFALENNWRGPLRENGAVEGTLLYWQRHTCTNGVCPTERRWFFKRY